MAMIALGGLLVLIGAGAPASGQRLDLDLGSPEWKTETRGAFSVHLDRRGVLTMSHADVPARAGDFGSVSRLVDLPEKVRGPLILRFYLTDDYVGDKQQAVFFRDAVKERVSDWKEEVRFQQLLLDDVVVWSRDVLGPVGAGAGARFLDLDISDLVAKKTQVKVAFRVRDEADTGAGTFPGEVFWARPQLLFRFGDQPPPVQFPPRLPFRREKFRALLPAAPLSGRVTLTVKNPSGVSLPAWPIRWGVPLPAGAVKDASRLALADSSGKPLPLQTRVQAHWSDGSVKWALLDFVAPLGKQDATFSLQCGADVRGATVGEAKGAADLARLLGSPPGGLLSLQVIQGGGEATLRATEPPAELRAAGPVCTEVQTAPRYAGADHKPVATSLLTALTYEGVPAVFVRHTLEVAGRKGGLTLRRIGFTIPGAAAQAQVGIGGAVQEAPAGQWTLTQESETVLTLGQTQTAKWDGWVLTAGPAPRLVSLRWPWQQYPDGWSVRPDGARLMLLDVPEGRPPATLAPGEAKTHELMIWHGPASPQEAALLNAVFQQPPVVVLPPGWVAATGVFGPFLERDERRFPEYESAAAALASGLARERDAQHAYGFEDLGDSRFQWGYGEPLTYWANTEYDHAHALLWQFLRTGDPQLFYEGCRRALHYRDVDLIHGDDEHPAWVGGAHHHSESHTAHGPSISHHWTEGLFDHYLLTGDSRSLECGRLAADFARRVALRDGYSGSEREAGWNLIALMGAYRATGDPALLQAATKKVDDVLGYLDPVRGVSSGRIFEQTAYEGGTPFMAGVLMRGLTMVYHETHDERVGWAICGLCDWLGCEMMPARGRFSYKQAPQLRQAGPLLLVLDGAAFAWSFTGDPVYRRLALDVYREGVGSTGITNMRDMPHALALLATALPPVAVRQVDRPLLATGAAPPEVAFTFANLSGRPERADVKLTSADSGDGPAPSLTCNVPAGDQPVAAKVAWLVKTAPAGVRRARYAVSVGDDPVAAGEVACLALPRAPRVLLLASESNLTAQALRLLGVPCARREPGEFAPALLAEADLLMCGFDTSTAALAPHAAALGDWLRSGGVILAFRGDASTAGWLPSPLRQDASYQPGEILKPDSGPFSLLYPTDQTALAAVHSGSMYRAFYDLGAGWTPLASAGKKQAWDQTRPASDGPHYGLVELRVGRGAVTLCQLIPEYAWLNDDAGRFDSPGRRLLENLLASACLAASR